MVRQLPVSRYCMFGPSEHGSGQFPTLGASVVVSFYRDNLYEGKHLVRFRVRLYEYLGLSKFGDYARNTKRSSGQVALNVECLETKQDGPIDRSTLLYNRLIDCHPLAERQAQSSIQVVWSDPRWTYRPFRKSLFLHRHLDDYVHDPDPGLLRKAPKNI